MECKPESTAVTLLRIQVIAMQGLIRSVVMFLFWTLMFPFSPFFYAVHRFRNNPNGESTAVRVLKFPLALVFGIVSAAAIPFIDSFGSLAMTARIVRAEWSNRAISGTPKMPDGKQMDIQGGSRDGATMMDVIGDYDKGLKDEIEDSTA